MSHLSSGGDSYRLVPPASEGGLGLVGQSNVRTTLPTGPMSAHEMRRMAREAGIPIGDPQSDEQDFDHVCRHEAGHAAAAATVGGRWKITSIDARRGETRIQFPPTNAEYTYADREREFAIIAAAGTGFTNSYSDAELASDRWQVRNLSLGHIEFADARAESQKLAADPRTKRIYNRVTNALLAGNGRLEGAELQRVLNTA